MAYEFQDRIIRDIQDKDVVSLILPTGAGKTRIALLWSTTRPKGQRMIVCPNVAVAVWEDEIRKWLHQPSVSLLGMSRRRKLFHILNPVPRWLIVPYQTFRSLANHMIKRPPPTVAILDESHSIQNPKAKVTQAVHTFLSGVESKAILTADPFGNSHLDLWAQWYFLDRGQALGKSFYQYRYNHFKPDIMGWNWTLKHASRVYINKVMQLYGVIMDEAELDLPPKTFGEAHLEMTSWQRRMYRSLKEEFAAYFKDGRPMVETQWIMTQLIKMRQVCSGFIITDEKKIVRGTSEKYQALLDIIKQNLKKHKLVVWCAFRYEIRRIQEMLNEHAIGHVIYTGATSPVDRKLFVREFQKDKQVKVFVGQTAAGGQSITLTAADRVVYFSNVYPLRLRNQSEGRTRRIGSEEHKRIHYIDLMTKDTIEPHLYGTLVVKKMANDMLVKRHLMKAILGIDK